MAVVPLLSAWACRSLVGIQMAVEVLGETGSGASLIRRQTARLAFAVSCSSLVASGIPGPALVDFHE